MSNGISTGRFTLAVAAALAIGAGAGFFIDRAIPDDSVRDYLLANPEILPEMVQALQTKDARAQLAEIRTDLETPFPGAVLGNPTGAITLVEFTDYACTYCRASFATVQQLIEANPDLRVVIREWPILSEDSAEAARMALAAARQGKYEAFHQAMYEVDAPAGEAIAMAAERAGLDMAQAEQALADPAIEAELQKSSMLARRLGFDGTPAWVVGDTVLAGAVDKNTLADAIQAARE